MIDILQEAAKRGAEVLKKHFRGAFTTVDKSSFHDIVTQADIEAQQVVVKQLEEAMKKKGISNYGFIGEENLLRHPEAEYTFIIDPLDGTSNFAKGLPLFCVSIALARNQEVISGVIYDVMRDTMYWAEKGNGCYKNNNRLPKLPEKILSKEIFVIHISSDPQLRLQEYKLVEIAAENMHGIRILGSITLKLSWMSEGIIGLTNGYANIWDIAAAKLIYEEVGGVVLDGDSYQPLTLNWNDLNKRQYFLAGENKLLRDYLKLLKIKVDPK